MIGCLKKERVQVIEMEATDKKLEDLAVGDWVYYTLNYGQRVRPMKINRVTKTQIICGNSRFNRRTGREVGNHDVWNFTSIYPLNDAALTTFKRNRVKDKLTRLGNEIAVTDENYEAIAEHIVAIEALGKGAGDNDE